MEHKFHESVWRGRILDSFEVIQEKLQEVYGEHTAYEMFWGDGRMAELKFRIIL